MHAHKHTYTHTRTQERGRLKNCCRVPLCHPPASVASLLGFHSWLPLWSECPACWPPELGEETVCEWNQHEETGRIPARDSWSTLTTAVRPVGLQRVCCVFGGRGANQVTVFVFVVGVRTCLWLLCLTGCSFFQCCHFLKYRLKMSDF